MRFLLVLLAASPLRLGAQPPRFRWSLRDDDLPADARRRIDSMRIASDHAHGCPSRADTLWAADPATTIPTYWLEASIRPGCGMTALPNAVRRRLRDDSTSLRYYEGIVKPGTAAPEPQRAAALQYLIYSGEQRYLPLLLDAANKQLPGLTSDSNYNAPYYATLALAAYLSSSRDARRLVGRAAENHRSRYARQAGLLALATSNSDWSRRLLRELSLDGVDEYTRGRITRALAHAPCTGSLVFVEWFGVEGQDYSKCELPPDYR